MPELIESRAILSLVLGTCVGLAAWNRMPFPESDNVLQMILLQKPYLFYWIKWTYTAMLFSTPCIGFSTLFSLTYIFLVRGEKPVPRRPLPPYPAVADRRKLFLVVGELHHPTKVEPAEDPRWLVIPERGLFTGIAIFGAIGSGKTSCCMYPFAEQVLSYRADDPARKASGLVLEVKGDFCFKMRKLLAAHGRSGDYVEISLDGDYRYNPLHNDQEAYALAFGIASLLNNLFGKGKEPFWQQAYTNLVKFIILLHKVLYDYATLFDVYACAINPKLLQRKIEEGEARFQGEYLMVEVEVFEANPGLDDHGFILDEIAKRMKAPYTDALKQFLVGQHIPHESQSESTGENSWPAIRDDRKQQQFEAVKRWFFEDWNRIEPKLRTSIVEGISVFLSLFDDNPDVKRVFCPPKETYDPVANKNGLYGKPLPPFSELIEEGWIVALNFPVAMNPGLAKTIGTLMKQDFQRAVLNRIPQMEAHPDRHFREVLFLCDEYQAFATVGEADPSGDEKVFALSRQAKCIAIVATQSISSLRSTLPGETWRTLLQTFRTKIFLSLSDDFSAETASRLCGKDEILKPNYSISESGHNARVSMLTGKATAHRSNLSTSKSYQSQMLPVFEPKVFSELKNAQAIVLAYDGLNPLPPTYCFLKPYYLDPDTTYFQQVEEGRL
ncbi:MAG TPA: type IV secretion system DNA-binding domain-containing protein [Bryobacteraceae bacterium]|nr:type IV secretion system DNA-binding domain-containing protein [Bryobacteraceae bacterium]